MERELNYLSITVALSSLAEQYFSIRVKILYYRFQLYKQVY
uniref:Uncharacterized protein n=1 Tax=Osmundaria fimbriata TaxID=228265 RepID=A0A1Z1M4R6_OSMFI|nr:hypothetical protein [Osmundaria fimbriata]ARW60795.1 hypothetical protein [Osmundaria fimbriata]